MRTITTNTNLYTFNELSDDAKETAINDYRDGLQFDFMQDDMEEELQRLLDLNKLVGGGNVRYSLSYSQGDGASFTGEFEYNKTWRVSVETNHLSNMYSHWNTVDVTEVTSLKTDKDAPDATRQKIEQIVVTISKALEKYGYDYIEDLSSDEYITDMLTANDYEFNENGKVA